MTYTVECVVCHEDPRGKRHGYVTCNRCGGTYCAVHGVVPMICTNCRKEMKK